MSSLVRRPYIGNFQPNQREVVQHSPDAVVLINGDISLPGCARCNSQIDLSKYITSISTNAGTDSGGLSANFNLSIPTHDFDSLIRDAQFVLRPTLEVEIYFKGYFPVSDLYANNPLLDKSEAFKEIDEDQLLSYPYYPVFHGVVETVDHSYGGGFYSATVNCVSLLSFWAYQNISTNASLFGTRPANSKLKMSLVGHNYTKMTPYEILYTMFHDTFGAASEVAFAFSSKSNNASHNNELGKSLFSLAIEYWKKRFQSRITNLRLHGVSGVLFNSAQATFLSRLSTSKVGELLRGRFPTTEKSSKLLPFLSAAKSLGLLDERFSDALTFLEKTKPTEKPAELNIGQMQAFVMNIGQFGTVNLFESTYESKLAIAQKVTELTGFEFYQDVDGDFVYKPPMYNLDTSSSRVYRLEDIDLISHSHGERAPAVTVMTVKGSHFKNILGLGLEGDWGVRGQFVDYKLVAQYGWRPQSFDTTYFNNPQEMFFAAINRMDILNAEVNTASASIPLRPEIRPGYPVYIPSLDCFYYVKSISHQFSYGGQCTTSLTLTAKRAKFYAPGDPNKSGIDAIDLRNMTLPQRPLVAQTEEGRIKTVGFPNVVMTLDPEQINPLFVSLGVDAENIDNPKQLRNLLKQAETLGQASRDPSDDNVYIVNNKRVSIEGKTRGTTNLVDVAKKYKKDKNNLKTSKSKIEKQIQNISFQISSLEKRKNTILNSNKKNPKVIGAINTRIRLLEKKRETLETSRAAKDEEFQKQLKDSKDFEILTTLLKAVGDSFLQKNDSYQNPNTTANYLDLLSNKKSAFSNGSVPGSYRYFSASHPDPKQQGMPEITLTTNNDVLTKENVPPQKDVLGGGFLRNPTKFFPSSGLPEVELSTRHKASRGIRILTNDPKNPRQVVTTDKIRTLSFASHQAEVETQRLTIENLNSTINLATDKIEPKISKTFSEVKPTFNATIASIYSPVWESLKKNDFVELSLKEFPTELNARGYQFPTTETFAKVATITRKKTLPDLKKFFGEIFTKDFVSSVQDSLQKLYVQNLEKKQQRASDEKTSQGSVLEAREEENRFLNLLRKIGVEVSSKVGKKRVKRLKKKENFFTPIFPVSDQKGYEVVGNYRYGRDLEILPGGTLEQLLTTDVLRFADRNSIDDYLNALSGGSVTVQVRKNGNDGFEEKRVGGAEAVKAAEKNLIESIKSNPQSKHVRALIAAKSSKNLEDATQLDLALSNYIASSKDSAGKIPVVNTARLLGSIQNRVGLRTCNCRSYEADLLTDALNQEKFVFVSKEESQGQSEVINWYSDQMRRLEKDWKERQDALRGTKLQNSVKDQK